MNRLLLAVLVAAPLAIAEPARAQAPIDPTQEPTPAPAPSTPTPVTPTPEPVTPIPTPEPGTPAPAPVMPEPTAPAPAPVTPEPAPVTPAQPLPPPQESAAPQPEPYPNRSDGSLGPEWLWANADIGYSYADLASFNSSNFALEHTKTSGIVAGAGAGVRLVFLTLGVRARDLPMDDFNLVELDAEGALHARLGHSDLYLGARGGYAFSGSLSAKTIGAAASSGGAPPNVNVHGGNFGLMLGFDYYVNHYFSVGFDGNPEALILERPPAPIPYPAGSTPMEQQIIKQELEMQPIYKESGSSIGFAFLASVHLGAHF
jgi:hypothetical protein